MKILQLFTLFIFVNSFAQITTIEKLDGSIISATKAEYSFLTKKLTYWVGKDKEKVNYSDLKSVSNVNYIFRYFPQAKIFKGMFIKAETKDKVLAFSIMMKILILPQLFPMEQANQCILLV